MLPHSPSPGREARALVALLLAAACARAAKPSAADVVAKNLAARGGVDALCNVQTMVWLGKVESSHAPIPSMPFRLDQKRPGKTRMETTALGEKSVRVFDGVQGFRVHIGHGRPDSSQPYTPQEVRFAQASHGFDGPLLDCAASPVQATLAGVEPIAGRDAYHLVVRGEDVWVDAESWLELRADRVADAPGGAQRKVSVFYGDYRLVEGVRVPHLIETAAGSGETPDKLVIEKVILNAPLDDTMFENPGGAHTFRRAPPLVAGKGRSP